MKWGHFILAGIVVSMFYFPFEFTFLPGVNTKMAMGALGLVFVLIAFVYQKAFVVPKGLLILLILSSLVSLISFFSITYNHTPDDTYVSYIISAAVWLSAAFVSCTIIHRIHGYLDVELLVSYLAGVCVFQCAIALLINYIPAVQHFVDRWVAGGAFYRNIKRLYGIGAALDIAGTRFSCVLVALGYFIGSKFENLGRTSFVLYFLAFVIITVLGNMIARTTLVGAALGLGYMLLCGLSLLRSPLQSRTSRFVGTIGTILVVTIPIIIFFYNNNSQFHDLLRFGFEGFFSLAEKGEWEVSSNDVLEGMIVWPDNTKTWVIGDGYFVSQRFDPNYVGDAPDYAAGYYMGTDIGYCRFIFYFGIIGLLAICAVMIYAAYICIKEFPHYSLMFWIALLAGFIMWWKSATDIFVFFALFICASFFTNDSAHIDQENEIPTKAN